MDIEEGIAWKRGNFQFESESIKEFMEEPGRWYDFEANIIGNSSNERINITISRKRSLKEVLEMLEPTGVIKIKRNGKTVGVQMLNDY